MIQHISRHGFLGVPKIQNQEGTVVRVFEEFKFYYPVEITIEKESPLEGFPWLKPTDFLKTMSRMNDLSHLLGGKATLQEAEGVLTKFWGNYRAICPNHQLWKDVDEGKKDIKKCVPILLHGDEGVTYKKGGVLVLSFQGVLGYGTSKKPAPDHASGNELPLNFLGSGFHTRMLILVCPKDWGSKMYTFSFSSNKMYIDYNVWNMLC